MSESTPEDFVESLINYLNSQGIPAKVSGAAEDETVDWTFTFRSKGVMQFASYIAGYVEEEIERGNEITGEVILNAIDAFEGGAAEV